MNQRAWAGKADVAGEEGDWRTSTENALRPRTERIASSRVVVEEAAAFQVEGVQVRNFASLSVLLASVLSLPVWPASILSLPVFLARRWSARVLGAEKHAHNGHKRIYLAYEQHQAAARVTRSLINHALN